MWPKTPPRFVVLVALASGECAAHSGHVQAFRCWSIATMMRWLGSWGYRECAPGLWER